MDKGNLANKPLVEAIFEVRWGLAMMANQIPTDPLYDVLVGYLFSQIKEQFPVHVRLHTAQFPGFLIPHQAQHQFRSSATSWPVVQLGPGVLTVNETSSYDSEVFLPLCLDIYKKVSDFWVSNGDQAPAINSVSLRYIDADTIENGNIDAFLDRLGVTAKLPEKIQASGRVKQEKEEFQLNVSFKTQDPIGQCALNFYRAQKDGKDALIWETAVISAGDDCKGFVESPSGWLDGAHTITHDCFFSLIDGELLERYR